MSFLKRRRRFEKYDEPLEDPMSGVANLFDVSVVFIVSMMMALFMAYNMIDLMNPKSEVTITKKNAAGDMEIITKKGKEIKVQKVTDKKMSGEGVRLGTAYQLKDGKVVYVPE
jgi:hypothetical protein